jgi:hypothetical protein
MKALQNYRDNKAKLIEGEVVDDIEASEEIVA